MDPIRTDCHVTSQEMVLLMIFSPKTIRVVFVMCIMPFWGLGDMAVRKHVVLTFISPKNKALPIITVE